jgi:metal-responsive CopG/Arc/MetJ family transcriptional regulator
MEKAIGVRLPEDLLKQIEKLSEEEVTDRSTTIRKLVMLGYKDLMKRRSEEGYLRGSITFSEAAHRAGLTLWEMEKYLVEQGFKSSYSIEDRKKR